MEMINNKNGVTTELMKKTSLATAAILDRIMIQSELHSDMEKKAEMTFSPVITGQQVTDCNLESELTKFLGGEVNKISGLASLATAA